MKNNTQCLKFNVSFVCCFISGEPTKPTRTSIIRLVGELDSDKTALMANWPKHFHACHPGSKVITHFVGTNVITHFVGSSALVVAITIFSRWVTYELRGKYVGECRL